MTATPQRLLPFAAGITALAAGIAPLAGNWPAPALWHLAFAVGALPMILAAMAYFVPVLTRSGEPPRALALLPLSGAVAGLLIVGHFVTAAVLPRLTAPWLALAAVALFATWLSVRARRCLGRPNPCLTWYAVALGFLALGLIAVALAPLWPEQAAALRRLHLHANTLGFMGLTALGTLRVLLPTVAAQGDPTTIERLQRDLPWSAGGALAIALGAAYAPPLAALGAAAYAWPLLRLVGTAVVRYRAQLAAGGNALPLLVAAPCGLLVASALGILHGFGIGSARADIAVFVIGFLLPLVSGAASQLLPVWLRPGAQTDWHRAARQRLAFGARLRAALLLGAGVLAAADLAAAYVVGLACAVWLAAAMLREALSEPISAATSG